ncbi:uncharacterized protein NP_1736A [Natronomonas pharaonis DSM 2160]|uniref:Uncharacterized protein n=1 Tax=Natronomonas pharaonis (strain ATCC 35678 / DSM 2160 / CIP 103997 / JCM 8858 / NBRC 14720 / NCIMB 2260 / Gabara) TaxID=348780 RepID=A0A1U7EVB7_NATPD|nr:hypothetical protein [Natronomonas pharaonis]CAI48959.1 uncharacterized protein NP_1736A [Natronomonas pharaonis DSM 2160]
MSVAGLCEICESATVEDRCDRCARLVCADHYDRDSGLCTDCRAEYGDRPPTRRGSEDYPDGVDEYRF